MRYLVFFLLLLGGFNLSAQIVKTAGIPYTATTPAHTPSASGSAWALDTANLDLYVYYAGGWNLAGERIQSIVGCVVPAYTPGKGQSLFVINACDSLYYYRGGAWRWINADTSGYNSTLTYSGDTLYLTDGAGTLSVYVPTGGAAQVVDTFEIVSNTLRLSLSDDDVPFETVDLSPYLDNTDDQKIDTFSLTGNTLRLSVESDGEPAKTVDLSAYLDNTDAQTLSIDSAIVGSNERFALSISNGNTVRFDVPQVNNAVAGTQSQIAYFSGANSVASKSAFAVDTVNNHLRLNDFLRFRYIGANATAGSIFAVTDNTFTNWRSSTGTGNVALGVESLNSITSGGGNIAIGSTALRSDTSGSNNIGIGTQALLALTSGSSNISIGSESGKAITTGVQNVLLGGRAGLGLTTHSNNTFVGFDAGYTVAASNNIAIGRRALVNATSESNVVIGVLSADQDTVGGNANVIVGSGSGRFLNESAGANTLIGGATATTMTSGFSNTAVGYNSLAGVNGASGYNVVIGDGAGTTINSAIELGANVVVGRSALNGISTSAYNTLAVGQFAGANAGGSRNMYIGNYAGYGTTGNDNLFIENADSVGYTIPLIGGKFSTNRVGIYLHPDSAARRLDVNGEVRIRDLQTDNPTRLVGADADGDLNRVILGSNLSMSGDTLNASAGSGNTDLSFSGASSPVTLNSSTGNDVTITAGSNITLTATGSNITIAATGGASIDSTSARNTGASGEGLYSHEAANVLNFKKLIAGSNITLTAADSSVTIAAAGSSPTVITPSTITSDQDNYNPTGWATATIVRISGDSMIRAITGFASAGIADGHEKKLINVGSYPVYIPGEHPDSQDSNRVNVGYDYMIYPKATCWIMYDNTLNRWVITSKEGEWSREINYGVTPNSITAGDYHDGQITNLGTGASTNFAAAGNLPSGVNLSTGTGSGSGSVFFFAKNNTQHTAFNTAHIANRSLVSLSNLSDNTDDFTVEIRISNAAAVVDSTNNSVGVRYNHKINGGDWTLFSRDNAGAETSFDLGVVVAAETSYAIDIYIDKSKSEARAYINNVYVGRVAANMPNNLAASTNVAIARTGAIGSATRSVRVHSIKSKVVYP